MHISKCYDVKYRVSQTHVDMFMASLGIKKLNTVLFCVIFHSYSKQEIHTFFYLDYLETYISTKLKHIFVIRKYSSWGHKGKIQSRHGRLKTTFGITNVNTKLCDKRGCTRFT